jgi:hypothetical protein
MIRVSGGEAAPAILEGSAEACMTAEKTDVDWSCQPQFSRVIDKNPAHSVHSKAFAIRRGTTERLAAPDWLTVF